MTVRSPFLYLLRLSCHCSPYVRRPILNTVAAKARTESSAELPFRVALRVRITVVPLLSVRAQTGFEYHTGKRTYGKQCRAAGATRNQFSPRQTML
jgi:hypothetical protein